MRHISFSADIYASRETIWKLLVDKVVNPGDYVPGVVEAEILERHDHTLTREVRTRGMVMRERITIDEPHGEIEYLLIEHPLLSGRVVNRLVSSSVQSPVASHRFTIEADWAPKDDDAEKIVQTDMPAQIQQEVLSLKEKAEELENGR